MIKKNVDSRSKLGWIRIAQVTAMFLIVFSHSIPGNQDISKILVKAGYCSVYIALPTFMYVSGYLIMTSNTLKEHGYRFYLKKRFVRLMVPYVCFSILMFLPKYLLFSSTGLNLSVSYFYELILVPRRGILPHLWFLPTLMLLTLLSPIIELVTRRKLIGLFGLILAAILLFLPDVTNFFCLNDVKSYLFWYMLGFFMAQHFEMEKAPVKYVPIITGGGYLILILLVLNTTTTRFIESFLSLIFVLSVSLIKNPKNSYFWDYMSNQIFTIYILSLPIQNIVEIICVRLSVPAILTLSIMFIIGVIMPILIIKGIQFIEEKTSVKFVSKILGM